MYQIGYQPRGLCARSIPLFSILPMLLAVLNWQPLYEPGSGGAMVSIQVSPHDSNRVMLAGDMLGNGLSTDGGTSWGPTFGFRAWEMADITWHPTDPNVVWAATMMGPYKSTDGGTNFVEKRSGFPPADNFYSSPVQTILFDPNNSNRLLAFCGTHRFWGNNNTSSYGDVYESTNGGESWSLKSTVAADKNIMTAEFAPGSSSVIYAAVAGAGLFKSADGGSSWTAINSGTPNLEPRFIAVHPTDGNTAWASFENGRVYKTTNGGASWSLSGNLPADSGSADYHCVVVSHNNPNLLYTSNTYPNAGNGGIYKSTDGGASWTKVTGSNYSVAYPAGPQMSWIEFDPANDNTVYAVNTEYVLKTTNGGSTWTDMTSFRPGSDTGLWRGRGYSGLVCMNFRWNPYATNHAALLAMDAGKMWVSKDGLSTWRRQSGLSAWNGGSAVTFSSADPNLMYATFGQFGWYDAIAKSTDGGNTWTAVSKPSGSTDIPIGIYIHPTDNAKVWVTVGGKLYYSTNGGSSWSDITPTGASSMCWIEEDRSNPLTFYVSAANGIYKTTNGTSFSLMSGSPTAGSGRDMRIEVDPNDGSRIYVANWRSSTNAGLHRYTTTGGWTRINGNYYAANAAVDPSNPNRVVMCTSDHSYHDYSGATGVYVTENALDTTPVWVKENAGLPMLRGEVIEFDPHGSGQLVFGSFGRGYFITTFSNTAPATPSGLAATAGDTQVTLNWNATSGASTYNVKRSTASGGPYSNIATGVTVTTYTNTGLTNGTTYYYVVSAVNSAGESGNSNEASATPAPQPPPVPTGVVAIAGDATVSLSWEPSSGATSYNVKRSTTSGSGYSTIASSTTNGHTDNSVFNDTTYYYVVSALNANGESANSSEASARPSGTASISPGTASVDGTIDSAWSSATSYTISNVSGTISSSSDLSGTWKALWDSTNLYVLVEVTDDSKWNDSTNAWEDDAIELYLDGNNDKTTSYDSNDRQYTFGWNTTAVTEGGGRSTTGVTFGQADPTSTSYRIELKVPWSTLGVTASGGKLIGIDVHVNDDDDGTAREGKKMWNDTTDSAWSNPSKMGTAQLQVSTSPPATPTGLLATAGDAQVSLSWNAASGADSYNVKRSTTSGSGYSTVASVNTTSLADSGLTNGTTYYYVVSAVNANGESGNSSEASATPTATVTGAISQEIWTNVSGYTVADIPLGTTPNQTGTLPSFEAATNWTDNYGQRVRGYLHPPTSGSYTFWIASDDHSELWLSTDADPANKVRIAYVNDWTNSREWNKHASQKSASISLSAGQRYYIEALQKEGSGGDNLAVGWLKPGESGTAPSEVVPGSALSVWDGSSQPPPTATSMHVSSIVVSTVGVGGGNKRGQAQVTILDNLGNPVSGATVTGSFSGSISESGRSGITNSSGIATIQTSGTAKGKVNITFCIDGVTHASLTYNSAANLETCDSGS